jgi:hypothetical protein
VVRTTPNGFVMVWWRVLFFVCVELAAVLNGQGSALRTENTAGAGLWRVNFINGPRPNCTRKDTREQ